MLYALVIINIMKKTRLEALSDGVFAVAITLLIFDVHLPGLVTSNTDLLFQLKHTIPRIAAYVLTFCIVAILWNGHHTILSLVKHVDRTFIWLNLLYLMFVAFMPFPTSILSMYTSYQAAVIFYSSVLICIGLLHFVLLNYIYHYLPAARKQLTPQLFWRARLSSLFGAVCGVVAVIVSFVSVHAGLFVFAAVPLYYVFINRTKDDLVE
jgi:TMEM175 potassium channel family protein